MNFDSVINQKQFFRFTGPPEHWLTAIKYFTWGLEGDYKERWKGIQTGDIFFIHSTGAQTSAFPNAASGIIGIGVVGFEFSIKNNYLWHYEIKNNINRWPLLIPLTEIYLFSELPDPSTWESPTPQNDASTAPLISQLVKNRVPIAEVHGFPQMGSFSRVSLEVAQQGKTFKACNWIEVAQFTGAPYLYLDKKPITIRHLFEAFGTLELPKLKEKLGGRLIVSKSEVLPQKMYMYILNKKTRNDFFLSHLDRIYSFDDCHFSPEYGLTGNINNNAITYNDARKKIQNIGANVIAGYLEKNNSDLYSSIIIKNRRLFLNIRKRIQDVSKLHRNQEGYQLKTAHLSKLHKTAIIYGDYVNNKITLLEKNIKSGKFKTIVALSHLQEDIDQTLDNIIKIAKSANIKTVISYDYFHGFNFVKI